VTTQTEPSTKLGGDFTLPNTSITLNRMGYGAMKLPGPGVWGPPRDVNAAIAISMPTSWALRKHSAALAR
jgi:hypothetical protein